MTDPQSGAARIRLDGALTVRGVESVHADLAAALQQHAMVIVDCSAATEVDLSVIQLLLAARRTAQRGAKTLSLAGADNTALRTALLRGGFVPAEPSGPDPGPDSGPDPGVVGPDTEFWLGMTGTA
jgi:ABC-type transporter Mla MlaB component